MGIIGSALGLPFKAVGKAVGIPLKLGLKASWELAKWGAKDAVRSAAVVGKAGVAAAELGLKAGHKTTAAIGSAGIGFFGGAGTVLARTLRESTGRAAITENWSKIGQSIGTTMVQRVKDSPIGLKLTVPGIAILGAAKTFDNSRDIYTQEKARRMGTVENKPVSLTPNMAIPQYEFNPRKRMGALDGGASGSLVFALHNNR